ncbi:U3 small nucleolar RNA-associated protein 18 homolog isoform X2 [Dermacentor andersoni]|uniref:U3 small nucleolar RNA-associated protein 18 homolog isoform X2 n=1 Tax=Dermacentor andersoni TaxID=34620 RepID=UPI0021559430|nr:U3 small nucleolar RNA-associated protein 18 homolog isoform X2 [Dermacentor andersoni]
MLRTAVETKLLPARQDGVPITKSVDIIEDEGSSDEAEKDSEEESLEKLVFGSSRDPVESSHVKRQRKKTSKRKTSECEDESDAESIELLPQHAVKKPAWQDEDDNDIQGEDKEGHTDGRPLHKVARKTDEYSDHLRKKYTKIMGVPRWAEQSDADKPSDDEEDDEILRKATRFVGDSKNLPTSTLQIHKCTPLAFESRENSVLKSVEFHPNSQVALVAALSGTATICQVDGKTNAKIQAVHFDRFPIYCAHFSLDGHEIWAGSSQKDHMFCYDMMAGKTTEIRFPKGLNITNTKQFYVSPDGLYFVLTGRFGEIYIVSAKSKECLDTLKMNKQVKCVAFSPDGSLMYTIGGSDVCIWDMKSRRCRHRFTDHGCLDGLSLAASPNGQFLASGSDSGVVNVYETSKLFETRFPAPLKEIMNLTTEVTQLKFNCTSELLAMSSSFKPNAVKMVHFPSLTAFSNFPGKHDFRYSNCIDISPNSGYFLCGNNLGTAHLFRLKHYSNF